MSNFWNNDKFATDCCFLYRNMLCMKCIQWFFNILSVNLEWWFSSPSWLCFGWIHLPVFRFQVCNECCTCESNVVYLHKLMECILALSEAKVLKNDFRHKIKFNMFETITKHYYHFILYFYETHWTYTQWIYCVMI